MRLGAALAGVLLTATVHALPAQAVGQRTPIIVLPFSFFDTSGELRDQSADHASRLSTMAGELSAKLEGTGLYQSVPANGEVTACDRGDTACLLKTARQAGAALVLTGAVQKVSTMASDIWIGAFDAASGRRVFYRQLTFRGDTDEAWRHATSFLVHQIEADPPKVP